MPAPPATEVASKDKRSQIPLQLAEPGYCRLCQYLKETIMTFLQGILLQLCLLPGSVDPYLTVSSIGTDYVELRRLIPGQTLHLPRIQDHSVLIEIIKLTMLGWQTVLSFASDHVLSTPQDNVQTLESLLPPLHWWGYSLAKK